jgi:hypothetical protein
MIAIPTNGTLHTKTVNSLIGMITFSRDEGIKVDCMFSDGSVITHSRNTLIKTFKSMKEFTHLLWIDSDMVFERDYLARMLKHDKDIVCGVARVKGDVSYNIYKSHESSGLYTPIETINDKQGLIEIDATGMCFMLISRKVLIFIDKVRVDEVKSEDILFCEDAHNKGFKIYCDTTLKLGHLKTMELLCKN